MDAMPNKKHHIRLGAKERAQLETILRKGQASAYRQCHARILLLADIQSPKGGWSDSQIARAAQTSIPTVERVRRACVEHGLERALERKDPDRQDERKLGRQSRGPTHCAEMGGRPAGVRPLDPALARRTARGVGDRRGDQPGPGRVGPRRLDFEHVLHRGHKFGAARGSDHPLLFSPRLNNRITL